MSKPLRIVLLAGEPSGDRLGAALMAGLSAARSATFSGVGGPQMQMLGLVSRFPIEELAVFGIAEVLPRYRQLKRRIRETADWIVATQPDLVITIDSPDFCLRVARLVKAVSTVRIVHYVAPSVWAWRPGRAEKMAAWVDQVLAILPFEPPYFQSVGLRCDFVGHPVVADPRVSPEEIAQFRQANNIGPSPILLVLPGSRRGEVARLAPVFGEALRAVVAARPDLRLVVPAAPMVASAVLSATANWPGSPLVLDPRDVNSTAADAAKRAAFGAANLALAASGTVSLELAAAQTPMVIAYDMNWLSWQIMSRMAKIDTVTLVNLVTGRKTIEEFLGPNCTAPAISDALLRLAGDAEARGAQQTAMEEAMDLLGLGAAPPGVRAAEAVLNGLAEAT